MKSFSSEIGPPVPAAVVASWTPEALGTGGPAGAATGEVEAEAALQARIDEVVDAALGEQERALRSEAAAELRAAEDAAYQRGFEAGRQEGEAGEAARLRTAVAATEGALDELRAGELRWTGTIEENICALAIAVARHIVGRELESDIGPLAALVQSALAEFHLDQPMRIRINPSDLTSLRSVGADGGDPLAGIVGGRALRWHADAAIAPGGCIVEGRERIIDGRVDTALERIYRRLTYTHA